MSARPSTIVILAAALASGCATTRSSGPAGGGPLERAELARCAFERATRVFSLPELRALAGEFELYAMEEGGDRPLRGTLSLRPYEGPAPEEAGGLEGPTPLLAGSATMDFASLGAVVPGPLDSDDPDAPGVGLYAFPPADPGETAGDSALSAVLRLGAEANRRGRVRFDGAHTTLRIASIGEGRFGGEWTSAEFAAEATGTFCAVRASARADETPDRLGT